MGDGRGALGRRADAPRPRGRQRRRRPAVHDLRERSRGSRVAPRASVSPSSSRSAAPRRCCTRSGRTASARSSTGRATSSRATSRGPLAGSGFDVERRVQILLKHRMIDARQASRLRRRAAEMARWRKPPVLHHGDLRLKNAIVDPDSGQLARGSRLGELHFVASAVLGSLAGAARSRRRREGGVPRRLRHEAAALTAALPYLRALNVLNYAHHVESAARKKSSGPARPFSLALAGRTRPLRHLIGPRVGASCSPTKLCTAPVAPASTSRPRRRCCSSPAR